MSKTNQDHASNISEKDDPLVAWAKSEGNLNDATENLLSQLSSAVIQQQSQLEKLERNQRISNITFIIILGMMTWAITILGSVSNRLLNTISQIVDIEFIDSQKLK